MAYSTPQLLSDRGRAWLGSVEGVPPQQLPAHAEMAAKTGLMPFQDALMIKQMADQIRASGSNEPPPPNNVMQQKLAMISNRAPVPQMPPPPQMEGQSASPQQDPRMQGGLGTLPAPGMKFADGGIVAFGKGGTTDYSPAFMTAVNKIITREGTDVAKKISDEEGWSHWGISQASHPELGEEGIKNLTRDEAIAIYHKEYWKGSGADKIALADPRKAEVVMDTAVLQGPQSAARMYRETGGDLVKMQEYRKKELTRIGRQEGKEGNAEGWQNRVAGQGADLGIGAPTKASTKAPAPANRLPAAPAPAAVSNPYAAVGTPLPSTPPAPVAGLPAALPATMPPSETPVEAPAGLPAAMPSSAPLAAAGNPWTGVGTVPPGAIDRKVRPLGEVMRPGAPPPTADEIASYNKSYGPNWRTRYQGMTHPTGMEVTSDTVRRGTPAPTIVPPTAAKPASAAAPVARGTSEEMPEKALLDQIDVDAEMKKRGMTDEEKYLARARAGFAAAAQRGKFADKFATFGSTLAEGLGSLKAADRKTRADLEERASRRQEAIAALGLKQRELDITESLGLSKSVADYLKSIAALEGVKRQAMQDLQMDPVFREQSKYADDPTHPENAIAKAKVKQMINDRIAVLSNGIEVANSAAANPGMDMRPAKSYAGP